MRIGLLSDTHGHIDDRIYKHFEDCDELWHAGDVGTAQVITELEKFKPVKGVYGNIDGHDVRQIFPEDLWLDVEGFSVWITHIGGYPPKYNPRTRKILKTKIPNIMICGHSHIVKIMRDPALNNLLHINPGAAGIQGFHKIKTIMKFDLQDKKISNMQVIELGKRA